MDDTAILNWLDRVMPYSSITITPEPRTAGNRVVLVSQLGDKIDLRSQANFRDAARALMRKDDEMRAGKNDA